MILNYIYIFVNYFENISTYVKIFLTLKKENKNGKKIT